MTSSTLRILGVAAAMLVLGSACDGSKDGAPVEGTEGVDASSERLLTVARSICEAEQRCNAAKFSQEFATLEDCSEEYRDTFPLAGRSGDDVRSCQDAMLDLAVCWVQIACTTKRERCYDLQDTYQELCAGLDEATSQRSFDRHPLHPFNSRR